jgi:hypothetical protein
MVKIAILLLGITITVSKLGARWMPAEFRQAARILSWLLAAYVVIMLGLGIVAYLRPA